MTMKKILAILMAMMMIVTECVCVFAEECNLDEQVIVESTVETATVTVENPEIMEESETVTEPAEEEDAEIVTDETVIVNDDNGQGTAEESDCGSSDEPVNSEPVQEVIPETVAQPETEVAETENAEVVNAPVEVANEDTDSDPEEQIPAEVTVTKEEKVAAEVTAIEETASEPIAEVENVQSEKDNVTEVAAPEIIETANEETPADEEPAEEEKVIGMAVILEETPLYTSPEGEEIKDVILLEGELCVVYEYDDLWSYIGYYENKGYVETKFITPYIPEGTEETTEEVIAEIASADETETLNEETELHEEEIITAEETESEVFNNEDPAIELIVTEAAESETVEISTEEIENAELADDTIERENTEEENEKVEVNNEPLEAIATAQILKDVAMTDETTGETTLEIKAGVVIEVLTIGETETLVRYTDEVSGEVYEIPVANEMLAFYNADEIIPEEVKVRNIRIWSSIDNETRLEYGMVVVVYAELIGFEEDEYTIEWQYTPDQGQTIYTIPDAHDTSYAYYLDGNNQTYGYRIIVNWQDAE